MSTRTLEQIATDIADKCYDLAHGEYPLGWHDAQAKIGGLILAALRAIGITAPKKGTQ